MADVTRLPLHECFADLDVIDALGVLLPDRARRTLMDLIERGAVRSRGRRVGARERTGDLAELTLDVPLEDVPAIFPPPGDGGEAADAAGRPAAPITILHEDERLVALSKPSGVPVVPDRSRSTESCLGFLVRRELAARAARPPREWVRYRIVHRIDRLTSGLVLVARTPEVERRFAADFEAHRIEKEYLALLEGVVEPGRVTVDCPIAPGRKGKMRAQAGRRGARGALTVFDVIERLDGLTLALVRPRSGRTHQIRVHAWAMGHPLAIDPLYRVGPAALQPPHVPGMERLTLHAWRYRLPPGWEEPRTFTAPLPADLAAALGALGSAFAAARGRQGR